jgi:hypothetical protein
MMSDNNTSREINDVFRQLNTTPLKLVSGHEMAVTTKTYNLPHYKTKTSYYKTKTPTTKPRPPSAKPRPVDVPYSCIFSGGGNI